MSHVWNNYDPQGVFKDHRRDRYGQLVIGIVTRRPRIVFPTWEVRAISSETMNSWNSVRGFHGMPRVRRILGLRAIGGRRIFATTTSFDIVSRKCLSFHHQSGNNTGTIFFNRYNRFKPIRLDIELLIYVIGKYLRILYRAADLRTNLDSTGRTNGMES